MRRHTIVTWLAVAALAVGCSKKDGGEAGAKGSAAERKAPTVAVTVDGTGVATIDMARASSYVPLGSLLPPAAQDVERWVSIEVSAGEARTMIEAPAKKHPGLVATIYADRGNLAFGFFAPEDAAKKGKPQWKAERITAIALKTAPVAEAPAGGGGGGDGEGGGAEDEGPRPALDPKMEIKVVGPGLDATFTGAQMAALPTTTAPVGDTDTPGWTLPQILEAVGAKPTGTLVLYGTEGANLTIPVADLDPATSKAFIKLNRSGQLRFRLFRKTAATWETTGELRGLSRIELK